MADATTAPPRWRLLLLRHAEVSSHGGDVPVTAPGIETAVEVGNALGKQTNGRMLVLTGATLRTRQTGEALAEGARSAGATVEGPRVAFALRNPDLYLAGERIDMVSSESALAAQVDGMDAAEAGRLPFFREFLAAQDRIGWWLTHPSPPGDDAAAVAKRIHDFAASLTDLSDRAPELTVAVTHSPILRACALTVLGNDPGEPDWMAGLEAEIRPDRSVRMQPYRPSL